MDKFAEQIGRNTAKLLKEADLLGDIQTGVQDFGSNALSGLKDLGADAKDYAAQQFGKVDPGKREAAGGRWGTQLGVPTGALLGAGGGALLHYLLADPEDRNPGSYLMSMLAAGGLGGLGGGALGSHLGKGMGRQAEGYAGYAPQLAGARQSVRNALPKWTPEALRSLFR
jgi:hypothetical protein